MSTSWVYPRPHPSLASRRSYSAPAVCCSGHSEHAGTAEMSAHPHGRWVHILESSFPEHLWRSCTAVCHTAALCSGTDARPQSTFHLARNVPGEYTHSSRPYLEYATSKDPPAPPWIHQTGRTRYKTAAPPGLPEAFVHGPLLRPCLSLPGQVQKAQATWHQAPYGT